MNNQQLTKKITDEFCVGSAIAPEVFEKATRLINDLEYDPVVKEVVESPIADALNYRYRRFGQTVNPNCRAVQFVQEDGETTWQLKIFDGDQKKYRAPKGAGDALYKPPVPAEIVQQVAEKYEIDPPKQGQNFWDWVEEHPQIEIIVTEGGKKALSSISAGVPAVSLYGCNCGAKWKDGGKVELNKDLDKLAKGRSVLIGLDRDKSRKTKITVGRATNKLGLGLSQAGANCKVMYWNEQEGKGIDDLIAQQGTDRFKEVVKAAISFNIWKLENRCKFRRRVQLKINCRFIQNIKLPENAKLICIKAPKGTGKTEYLASIAAEAIAKGQPILIISHRINLCQEMCRRFGLPYVTELRTSQFGRALGYGLCIDSLHAKSQAGFNPENWGDALIFIDEAEQVFDHLLRANTSVGTFRREIAENLNQLFFNVSEGAGRIFLSDADLSDKAIDYAKKLCGGDIEPYIVENEWKPEHGYQIINFNQSNPDLWLRELLEYIRNGGIPLIFTDSQKPKSKYGTKNLESLLKFHFPDKRILRIDGITVAETDHPACGCVTKLNDIAKEYDIIIASPSLETGVSIDLRDHFSSVWLKSQGVTTSNSVRQMLARLRDFSVPRYLWISKVAFPIGSGCERKTDVLREQHDHLKNTIRLLNLADQGILLAQDEGESAHLETWATICADINAQRHHFREYTLYKLQQEGHTITNFTIPEEEEAETKEELKELIEEVKNLRDVHYGQECVAIADAPNPTDAQYKKLKAKKQKTDGERRQERKGGLVRTYGEEQVSANLVAQDDDGLYTKLKLHFYLTRGRKLVEKNDKEKIEVQLKNNSERLFKPDVNRKSYSTRTVALESIGIGDLLNQPEDAEFCNEHPVIEKIGDMGRKYQQPVQELFGFQIPANASNIRVTNLLLDQLGLKMEKTRRVRKEGGSRPRFYSYPVPEHEEDVREKVFDYWLKLEAEKPGPQPQNEGKTAEEEAPTADETRDAGVVHGSLYIDIQPEDLDNQNPDPQDWMFQSSTPVAPEPGPQPQNERNTAEGEAPTPDGIWDVEDVHGWGYKDKQLTDLDSQNPDPQDWMFQDSTNSFPVVPNSQDNTQEVGEAEMEWDKLIARIDAQIERIGWTTEKAIQHLQAAYGVKSRHLLTDEQVLEFLAFLEAQPEKSPFRVGASALYLGGLVRIERLVNKAVALVRFLGTRNMFEVAITKLQPG